MIEVLEATIGVIETAKEDAHAHPGIGTVAHAMDLATDRAHHAAKEKQIPTQAAGTTERGSARTGTRAETSSEVEGTVVVVENIEVEEVVGIASGTEIVVLLGGRGDEMMVIDLREGIAISLMNVVGEEVDALGGTIAINSWDKVESAKRAHRLHRKRRNLHQI